MKHKIIISCEYICYDVKYTYVNIGMFIYIICDYNNMSMHIQCECIFSHLIIHKHMNLYLSIYTYSHVYIQVL